MQRESVFFRSVADRERVLSLLDIAGLQTCLKEVYSGEADQFNDAAQQPGGDDGKHCLSQGDPTEESFHKFVLKT